MSFGNVDTDLRNAAVDTTIRHRTQSCPCDDTPSRTRDQTAKWQMRRIPSVPGWCLGFKGRLSGRDAFQIDRAHLFPSVWAQRRNHKSAVHIWLDRYVLAHLRSTHIRGNTYDFKEKDLWKAT